ncbi:MAG: flagellar hook-basal body complex protein FliE [Pseudomonadota bacterium]
MDISLIDAQRVYGAVKSDIAPQSNSGDNVFGRMVEDFQAQLTETEEIAKGAILGTADPHTLVEALANTQLAVETAVTVRDRVVEAYQEILRMPV